MRIESPDDFAKIGRVHTGKAAKEPRFRLEPFQGIELGTEPECLVKDVVPARGLVVSYGEPGCGKSFFAEDMGLHIALARPWAGKEVYGGACIYITAEGATGFRKRLVAFRQQHGIVGHVPFYLLADCPDLGQAPGDAEALIDAIQQQADRGVRLVVVDTLARAMAGGDENSSADMSMFVKNCERIGSVLECTVLVIHHSGKDAARGARGSTVLKAAADVEIMVSGSEDRRTATVTKSKDMETGLGLAFRLNQVVVETQDDREVRSCVVEVLTDWSFDATPPAAWQPTGAAKIALDALNRALDDAGEFPPASSHIPGGTRAVSPELWRRYFYQLRPDDSTDARRKSFQRARDTLQTRNVIGTWGEWTWTV